MGGLGDVCSSGLGVGGEEEEGHEGLDLLGGHGLL